MFFQVVKIILMTQMLPSKELTVRVLKEIDWELMGLS